MSRFIKFGADSATQSETTYLNTDSIAKAIYDDKRERLFIILNVSETTKKGDRLQRIEIHGQQARDAVQVLESLV